jgi:hypothetical protein
MGESFGLCRVHDFEAGHIEWMMMEEAGFDRPHNF